MSWRMGLQAARPNAKTDAATRPRVRDALVIVFHLDDMLRLHTLQKPGGFPEVELGIVRFDAHKEFIVRSALETLDIEQQMMWLRQLVEREHSKNRGKRCAKHGKFESNRNKCRPATQRAATDIQGISNYVDPIFKAETTKTASQPADQGDNRYFETAQTQCFGETFHGKRRICIDVPITGLVGFRGSANQERGILKFADDTVEM